MSTSGSGLGVYVRRFTLHIETSRKGSAKLHILGVSRAAVPGTVLRPATIHQNSIFKSGQRVIAEPKVFVLDTNVVLHDARCIEDFADNDVAIPITVLEELDKFKRGNQDIQFQARKFLRALDSLTGPLLSEQGVPRGPGLGNIRVVWTRQMDEQIKAAFMRDASDHRILNKRRFAECWTKIVW